MDKPGLVTIEFYGVPRQRAGRAELTVAAGSLADLLTQAENACPNLSGLMKNGQVAPHYLLSLEGKQFVTDLSQPLHAGDRVLLLSADVGG